MRFWKRTIPLLIMTGLFLSICGCSDNKKSSQSIQTIRIGIAAYRMDDAFISSLCDNMEQYAKKQESLLGKKIILTIADGKDNQSIQNDQVDNFINQAYNVICVNEVDRTVSAVIIDKAQRANIPVIFFNREPVQADLQMWNKAYYVGTDAKQSGMLQGQMVLDALKRNPSIDKNGDGKLQYVMLEGEPVHQDSVLRTEYSVKSITDGGVPMEKLANASANWQRNQASSKMQQWLDSGLGNQIEVVISNNDDMALGAIEALKKKNLLYANGGPLVVGIDAIEPALDAIRDGSLYGTIKNDADAQAETIVGMACILSADGDPSQSYPVTDGQYVRLPHSIITAQNLESNASSSSAG